MNPTWLTNSLHNLQLQLSFHPLICLLNDARVLMLLSSSGRLFQSLDPRKDKLSIPCLEVSAKEVLCEHTM